MNLERVSNEEKLNLCRKYYLGKDHSPRIPGEGNRVSGPGFLDQRRTKRLRARIPGSEGRAWVLRKEESGPQFLGPNEGIWRVVWVLRKTGLRNQIPGSYGGAPISESLIAEISV